MSLPSSPAGGGQPLQPVSHNAQRDSALFASAQLHRSFAESPSHRDSSVRAFGQHWRLLDRAGFPQFGFSLPIIPLDHWCEIA